MRYHREFAQGNGFVINDQHAGIESMPANMQHASKLGGTATNWGDKIKIKKKTGENEEITSAEREDGVQKSTRQLHKYRRGMEQLGSIAEMV